ncbi:hypothetical protein LWI28_015139 [Acer negundo]|uniref:Uncharacterized protein n=1 Tax=Acer negundo TaxID=4023 RepID=A0AAD5IAT0_ACENE|nr:hypothetical protein LWI28_015139 [Acer negundo]
MKAGNASQFGGSEEMDIEVGPDNLDTSMIGNSIPNIVVDLGKMEPIMLHRNFIGTNPISFIFGVACVKGIQNLAHLKGCVGVSMG